MPRQRAKTTDGADQETCLTLLPFEGIEGLV